MPRTTVGRCGALLLSMLLCCACAARAEFTLVEDFEGLVPGPIDEQNGWIAENSSSTVALDPIGGSNQVLSIVTESTHLHKALLLPDGEARMLFLRFRLASQLTISFGMSDHVYPSQFGDFEVEPSLANSSNELRINDDGSYEDLTPVEPDTWYNCWLWINNATDKTEVFLHARGFQPATAADRLDADGQTAFLFRDGTAGNLVTFYIKTGGGSGLVGPFYLDDLYIDDTAALNFSNPASQPGAVDGGPGGPGSSLELAAPLFGPNASSGCARVRFHLPRAGETRLEAFDLLGRRVAALFEGALEAGAHEVLWSGRDGAGRTAPAGVYALRLRAGSEVATGRVVLTR